MLTEFRLATFDGCLNTEFQVIEDETSICVLQLTDINELAKTLHQEIFSLMFHGPPVPFMSQGIRRLRHKKLGELELFLVPVGQDQEGYQYEAAFNLKL